MPFLEKMIQAVNPKYPTKAWSPKASSTPVVALSCEGCGEPRIRPLQGGCQAFCVIHVRLLLKGATQRFKDRDVKSRMVLWMAFLVWDFTTCTPVCWSPTGPKSRLVWHDERQATEKEAVVLMSRQQNECETESEENVEAILVPLLMGFSGGTACSLANPYHNSDLHGT